MLRGKNSPGTMPLDPPGNPGIAAPGGRAGEGLAMPGCAARPAVRTASPALRPAARQSACTGDDDLLAAVLYRMWALASGRPLPRNVRPDQLSEEELIGFWADDLSPAAGRHAARIPVLAGGRR